MIYWLFSIITALIAFVAGNVAPMAIASRFVFKKKLSNLGSGNIWFSRFRRQYGWKGYAKLALVELVLDVVPILIGGLLFGTKGHGDVGRSLAAFCLIISRTFPVIGNFTGYDGMIVMLIGLLFMNTTVGATTLVLTAVVFFGVRYKTLAIFTGALTAIATAFATVDNLLVMRLCVYVGVLVILRNIGPMIRLVNNNEDRIEFREDLSYKLDEKF